MQTMVDQGGLQLLPETRKKIEIMAPGENRILVIGAVILALVTVLASGLYFYENSLENKLVSLDSEITALEQQRDRKSEHNILIFNKQLSMLSDLLNSHTYWTTGLSKIERLAQNQIQLDSLIATTADNRVDFKATAPSYTTIARQIAAFLSDESITDISLNKVNTLTSGQLEFAMQISFNRSKFLQSR